MRIALLFPLAFLLACSGDKRTDSDPQTTPGDSDTTDTEPVVACEGDEDCQGWEICEDGACQDGDRNNDWEEAEAVLWEETVYGWLNPENDVDYYSFSASGGEWVRVDTRPTGAEKGESEANEEMDTVVSLYNPNGQLHAWEDDYPTGPVTTYDTVLFAYLPEAGTWTVVVENDVPEKDAAGGGEDFSYALRVTEYGGVTYETDALDDPNYEVELASGYIYAVGVHLEEEGDRDYISLELPYDQCPVLVQGSLNLTGSDANGRVRLIDANGDALLDQNDLGLGSYGLYPEANGDLVLEALDDEERGGDDYWFMVIVKVYDQGWRTSVGGVDYDYQDDSEPNDSQGEAQILTQTSFAADSGSLYNGSYAWGWLESEVDQDWYVFQGEKGWYLTVYSTASWYGSLLDPVFEVYDAGGELLGSYEGDSDDSGPDFENLGPLEEGSHYLRIVHPEGTKEGGPGHFYSFALYVTDFEVTN